jgi:ribosome-binding protein aMBF1 (putative translation factor)
MASEPVSYTELADVIANVPLLLREARRARGISQRKAAAEMAMSFSTVSRIEAGEDCMVSNIATVLRWLHRPQTVTDSNPGGAS